MELINKEAALSAIRDEHDRQQAMYNQSHHVERCGVVQGLRFASMIVAKQPTMPDIDRAEILRLCNEIEDIVTELAALCEIIDSSTYRLLCDKLRAIGKELTGDAGSKVD